ncbi:MAG: SAM-dependent methyltransferase, partial [Actinobacteria bacterium]|nr:SAM-dependent methyltransferase [Actinomycetota bacterium]
ASLRRLVGAHFAVEAMIEMHDVDAFEDDVSAYPAVTVIRRGSQGPAVLAQANSAFGPEEAKRLRSWSALSRTKTLRRPAVNAARLPAWFPGDELWPSGDPARLSIVAHLEKRFPPMEDTATGTRVGIGVASGADSVFLTREVDLVEEDRLLPLVMSADTSSGQLTWRGTYLVNPWKDGRLVDLEEHPRLASYFNAHAATLRGRHIAKKRPGTWYRTIDRVDPDLQSRPKLVLPDLKATIHPVLDDGRLYPHHNLYFVVTEGWDIEVLGGLLLSDVANLFVGTYCVKMRGGCYRFQAQYLRRIRVPAVGSLSRGVKRALATAFAVRDTERASGIAARLYGLNDTPAIG